MLDILIVQADLQILHSQLLSKPSDTNTPINRKDAAEVIKTTLARMLIVEKEVNDLYKDLKMKERSMVYHSMNCAKLTALNASIICTVASLEKQVEELKEGL